MPHYPSGPTRFTDFGDAVIASVCMSKRGSAIVTFDRKFAGGLKSLGLVSYTTPLLSD